MRRFSDQKQLQAKPGVPAASDLALSRSGRCWTTGEGHFVVPCNCVAR
jgi:hypothetical protein